MQQVIKYFYLLVYFLITFFLIGAIIISLKKEINTYLVQKSTEKIYENKGKAFLPEAVKILQTHKNDWIICTDLGLSLKDIDDPKIMASWVAYYKYGKIYCPQWWSWPNNNPCSILQRQRKYNSNRILLLKKITLCQIAKNINSDNL